MYKKKDSCEPRWWGLLSWQNKQKETTPSIGKKFYCYTLYIVLILNWSLGDGDDLGF